MSKLVEHAERELKLAGLFDKDSDYEGMLGESVLELVKLFSDQGHSGWSACQALRIFDKVAMFKALTPLTSNLDEWNPCGENLWQNKRQPSCFSEDGGKTYTNNDEQPAERDASGRKIYTVHTSKAV